MNFSTHEFNMTVSQMWENFIPCWGTKFSDHKVSSIDPLLRLVVNVIYKLKTHGDISSLKSCKCKSGQGYWCFYSDWCLPRMWEFGVQFPVEAQNFSTADCYSFYPLFHNNVIEPTLTGDEVVVRAPDQTVGRFTGRTLVVVVQASQWPTHSAKNSGH